MERLIKGVILFFIISCFSSLQVSEALGDCGAVWPEDPFHQALLLLESPISPNSSLILDAICQEYQQGIKHYLSLGTGCILGSVAILIDLDDYYGISAEGQAASGEWVTVYIRGGFDLHISLLPVTVAYIVREGVDLNANDMTNANAADPYYDPEYFWGVAAIAPGWKVQTFNNVDHSGPNIEPSPLALNIKVEMAKAWYTIGPVEVKKQVVEAWFNDLAHINGSIPGQAVGTLVGQNIISQIFNFDPDDLLFRIPTANDGVPSPPPASPDFEPAGIFFDTTMPVQLGTTFNIDLRIKNRGLAQGTGELLVYLVCNDEIVEIVYDSKDTSPITLNAASQTSLSFPLDTSSLMPGQYVLKTEIYDVTPSEASTNNNRFDWGFHITANPTGSIDSILPNPAIQGMDTIVFTASGSDPDNQGALPEICTYRWTSDLGKIDGQSELYEGTESSFSIPAYDLRAGTHNMSLTVQDNEGDWSEQATTTLTVQAPVLEEGHDVAIGVHVPTANIIHLPTEPVSGEVWADNLGEHTESGTLSVQLRNASGTPLDSKAFPFSSLSQGQSTQHYSFSLNPSGYVGEANVRAIIVIEHDLNLANNERRIPVSFSTNLNPTDSFDGYEELLLGNGESYVGRDGTEFFYEDTWFYVNDESFRLGNLESREYVLLPNVVFQYNRYDPQLNKHCFNLWWPENLYTFSTQFLTVPWGGSATFDISRTSGSWSTIDSQDVEFLSGLLPPGWSSSVIRQGGVMTVEIHAIYGSGSASYNGWAHLKSVSGAIGRWWHAFQWMNTVAVGSPPSTAVLSGPPTLVAERNALFSWTGSDDTTPVDQLEYAWRLDGLESEFGEFTNSTYVTYSNLPDGYYTFRVKARDLGGIEDPDSSSWSFTVSANRAPDLPINQYPLSNQSGTSLTPPLIGSNLSDPDSGDTHAKSQFQLRADTGTYQSPVWDSGELTPGVTSVQIPASAGLRYNSRYWWRCRYQDNKGSWSAWSNDTSFVTGSTLVGDFCGTDFGPPDGYVDVWDLMQFADHWHTRTGEGNWHGKFDLTGPDFGDADGYVDVWDLMVFADHWHEGEKP